MVLETSRGSSRIDLKKAGAAARTSFEIKGVPVTRRIEISFGQTAMELLNVTWEG